MLENLKECCSEVKILKLNRGKAWIPPSLDTLYFNVDGSAKGAPGRAGIGGVLRDSRVKVMCLFSAFSGFLDANAAEIKAMHEAVNLYTSKAYFHY